MKRDRDSSHVNAIENAFSPGWPSVPTKPNKAAGPKKDGKNSRTKQKQALPGGVNPDPRPPKGLEGCVTKSSSDTGGRKMFLPVT